MFTFNVNIPTKNEYCLYKKLNHGANFYKDIYYKHILEKKILFRFLSNIGHKIEN